MTSIDLVEDCRARADRIDPALGAFLIRDVERARTAAATADDERARGIDRGPLHGIPVGFKGIFAVQGIETSAQSRAAPAPGFYGSADAPAVARLRAAGATVMGTMTTMEYAIGMPDPSDVFPSPCNPYDLGRWAGGSSSGTASGVAAGLALGGLGTDTGGSIRLPAAWCGITGLKPTFGLVPTSGVVPLAESHDTVGPMARTARDCALLLGAAAGAAPGDRTPEAAARPAGAPAARHARRIGVPFRLIERAGCLPEISTLFEQALEVLTGLGCQVVPVELPLFEEMQVANDVSKVAEAWARHRENLRTRWHEYGVSARTTIVRGAMVSAADYLQAQRVRHEGTARLRGLFSDVDAVATPTSPTTAPVLFAIDHADLLSVVMTPYWSACGFPALSLPMGMTAAGLPAGLQLAGPAFADAALLSLATRFQEVTDHHDHRPPMRPPEPP